MTKKDVMDKLTDQILEAVGGDENIVNLTHCQTRAKGCRRSGCQRKPVSDCNWNTSS